MSTTIVVRAWQHPNPSVFSRACQGQGADIHLHERGPIGAAAIHAICDRVEAAAATLEGKVAISHAFVLGGDGGVDKVFILIDKPPRSYCDFRLKCIFNRKRTENAISIEIRSSYHLPYPRQSLLTLT
jgi:hypothetical protein